MDIGTASARLMRMVSADIDPQLDSDAITDLLSQAARYDPNGNSPRNTTDAPTYTSSTTYLPGDVVRSGTRYWRCLIGGMSTGTTFPDLSGQLLQEAMQQLDGYVLWVDNGTQWVPTYDLNRAAEEGWRLKAAKASERYDFAKDNQQFSRSQLMANCLQMVKEYKRRPPMTVTIEMPAGAQVVLPRFPNGNQGVPYST